MAFYENTFIARPDLSSRQAEELAERYAGILGEHGGKVAKTENWGLRSLTYRIKKHRKGHYLHLAIEAPSTAIKEMERNMKIDEDVLRFLTVRVDALDPEPSPVLASRGRDDERRGRGRDGDRWERGEHGERGGRERAPRESGESEGSAPAAGRDDAGDKE
jgi:small subunit ribosomal protein S6